MLGVIRVLLDADGHYLKVFGLPHPVRMSTMFGRDAKLETIQDLFMAREVRIYDRMDGVIRRRPGMHKELSVFDRHQIRIARGTLKLSDAGARILGGMTKEEARAVLRKFGIRFKE